MDIIRLIRLAETIGASDLRLSVSSPAMFRLHGELMPAENNIPLTAQDMEEAFDQITSEERKGRIKK